MVFCCMEYYNVAQYGQDERNENEDIQSYRKNNKVVGCEIRIVPVQKNSTESSLKGQCK